MDSVKAADLVASMAHRGQVDKMGTAYIEHPRAVASFLETETEKTAALLHDVLEDTYLREEDLRPVFGDEITDAVVALTRREGEDYFDYIRRVMKNALAVRVKLADLRHNTDRSRIKDPGPEDFSRWDKYQKAIDMLRRGEQR